MGKRIVIIQGHPDSSERHFCHALTAVYAQAALAAGHEVQQIDVATLDFSWLHSKQEWEHGVPPAAIAAAQNTIAWADHLLICYPLWLGSMPAVLKAFFEQFARPGFALAPPEPNKMWKKLLTGKSARIVITMGMPALVYRWYFGAHSLKSLERNILGFCGIAPIRETLIGMIEHPDARRRAKWIRKLESLGQRGL